MLLSKTFAYVAKILLIFTILWINLVQTVMQNSHIIGSVIYIATTQTCKLNGSLK